MEKKWSLLIPLIAISIKAYASTNDGCAFESFSGDTQYARKCQKINENELVAYLCDFEKPCLGKRFIAHEQKPCPDKGINPQFEASKKIESSLEKILGDFNYNSNWIAKTDANAKNVAEAKSIIRELNRKSKFTIFYAGLRVTLNQGGKPEQFMADFKSMSSLQEIFKETGVKIIGLEFDESLPPKYFSIEKKDFLEPEQLFDKCE